MKTKQDESSVILTAEVKLVDARMAAALCGVSARFWHQLNASGKVPAALKLGRRSLWSVCEIDRWIDSGCPTREKWAQMRQRKDEKI